MVAGISGGNDGEVSVSKELSAEAVGALRGVQTPDNFMADRGLVPATYWPVYADGYVPQSATSLADARLVPLATPEAVPTLQGDAPSPQGVRGETGEETAGAIGAGGGNGIWEPSISGRIETAYDVRPVRVAFFQGYRDSGGQDEERIDAMILCESSWRINPGGHLGLAQFDPGTWATVSAITGFADPYNPYHQGFNVSVWASMVSPGTSAGWPSCFHAIDW